MNQEHTKRLMRELQQSAPHTPKQPPGTVETEKTEAGVVFYVKDVTRNSVWGWAVKAYDPTVPSGVSIVDHSTGETYMDGDVPLSETIQDAQVSEGIPWQKLAIFGAGLITGKTFFKDKLHSIADCASALLAIREFLEKRSQYRQSPQVLRAIDDLAALLVRMGG